MEREKEKKEAIVVMQQSFLMPISPVSSLSPLPPSLPVESEFSDTPRLNFSLSAQRMSVTALLTYAEGPPATGAVSRAQTSDPSLAFCRARRFLEAFTLELTVFFFPFPASPTQNDYSFFAAAFYPLHMLTLLRG